MSAAQITYFTRSTCMTAPGGASWLVSNTKRQHGSLRVLYLR
jgi:hypothetical protein